MNQDRVFLFSPHAPLLSEKNIFRSMCQEESLCSI